MRGLEYCCTCLSVKNINPPTEKTKKSDNPMGRNPPALQGISEVIFVSFRVFSKEDTFIGAARYIKYSGPVGEAYTDQLC